MKIFDVYLHSNPRYMDIEIQHLTQREAFSTNNHIIAAFELNRFETSQSVAFEDAIQVGFDLNQMSRLLPEAANNSVVVETSVDFLSTKSTSTATIVEVSMANSGLSEGDPVEGDLFAEVTTSSMGTTLARTLGGGSFIAELQTSKPDIFKTCRENIELSVNTSFGISDVYKHLITKPKEACVLISAEVDIGIIRLRSLGEMDDFTLGALDNDTLGELDYIEIG